MKDRRILVAIDTIWPAVAAGVEIVVACLLWGGLSELLPSWPVWARVSIVVLAEWAVPVALVFLFAGAYVSRAPHWIGRRWQGFLVGIQEVIAARKDLSIVLGWPWFIGTYRWA